MKKLFNNPYIFYQKPDQDCEIPEMPVIIHRDNGGIVCLEQEDRTITLNQSSLKKLGSFLKKY